MGERRQHPDGVPCWVETLQPDPAAAANFYGALIGWNCRQLMPLTRRRPARSSERSSVDSPSRGPNVPLTLFRLPGHVGGDPAQHRGLLQLQEQRAA